MTMQNAPWLSSSLMLAFQGAGREERQRVPREEREILLG